MRRDPGSVEELLSDIESFIRHLVRGNGAKMRSPCLRGKKRIILPLVWR